MKMEWFKQAKLGIFIHYGIYAVEGVAESWSFYNGRISYEDYMKQLDGLGAEHLDMDEWADLIQKSGAKYAVLTTKHHDGVALYDTAYSDLNTLKRTPAKRDFVKEYTDAIRARGINVGLYYSLIDWSHPDYASVSKEGEEGKPLAQRNRFAEPMTEVQDEERWQRFLEFDRGQLRELLSNYGAIDLLWFDGDWERTDKQWGLPEFKNYLLSLNPDVIINSRLAGYGDYETPEQGLPIVRPEGPWEFCTTINESWGYQHDDDHYKSLQLILRMFCDCISMGGNMLLDIGPKADGSIDQRQKDILLGLGEWISVHEEAVFGTGEGVGPLCFSGGSTISADEKVLYLFVYDLPREGICLKGLCSQAERITMLHSGTELEYEMHGGVPWFQIPGLMWIKVAPEMCHEQVSVIKIELKEKIKMYAGSGEEVTYNV